MENERFEPGEKRLDGDTKRVQLHACVDIEELKTKIKGQELAKKLKETTKH